MFWGVSKTTWRTAFTVLIGVSSAASAGPTRAQIEAAERKQLLQTPILPQSYVERWRLVPPSDEFEAARKVIDKLLRKIYREHDFQNEPFRIVLSDDPNRLAAISSNAQQPLLVISTRALQDAQSLDDIALLVSHEVGHVIAKKRRGEERRVGKIEETIDADLEGLKRLIDAGFSPEQALVAAKRWMNRKNQPLEDIKQDAHLLDVNRIRAMENYVASEKKRKGSFEAPVPLPSELVRAATLTHGSFVSEALSHQNFQNLPVTQKMQILQNLLTSNQLTNQTRIEEWNAAARTIRVDRSTAEQREAHDALVNAVLKSTPRNSPHLETELAASMLQAVASSTTTFEKELEYRNRDPRSNLKTGPGGDLVQIDRAIRAFRRAENRAQAVERARDLIRLVQTLDVPPQVLATIDWNTFPFPNTSDLEKKARRGQSKPPSWHQILEWAESDHSGYLTRALIISGIDDRRLVSLVTPDISLEHIEGKVPIIAKPPRAGIHTSNDLVFDSEGHLIGLDQNADPEGRLGMHRRISESASGLVEPLADAGAAGDQTAVAKLWEIVRVGKSIDFLHHRTARTGDDRLMGTALFTTAPDLFFDLNAISISTNISAADELASLLQKLERNDPATAKRVLQEMFLGDRGRGRLTGYYVHRSQENNSPLTSKLFQTLFRSQALTNEEKQQMIPGTQGTGLSGDHIARAAADLRPIFGIEKPETASALLEVIRHLGKGDHNARALAISELKTFLKSKKQLNIFDLLSTLSGIDLPKNTEKQEEVSLHNQIKQRLRSSRNWPTDTGRLVEAWAEAHARDFFDENRNRGDQLLERALNKIKQTPDPALREKWLLRLLSAPPAPDPELRDRLKNAFLDEVHSRLGEDDGTDNYQKKFQTFLDDLEAQVSESQKAKLYPELGKKLLLQRTTADAVAGTLRGKAYRQLHEHDETAGDLEIALRLLARSDEGRKGMIDFLVEPINPDTIANLEDVFQTNAHIYGSPHEMSKLDLPNFSKIFEADLKYTWSNFWKAPLIARAATVDLLLFPPDTKDPGVELESYRYIMDKLLPPSEPYSSEARRFLDAYHQALPDYQKRVFLSAALVAVERSLSSKEKLSIGARLAMVLEMLGPAETKLGQAINSHPLTPDQVREGTERLKHSADEPLRWELMDLYEAHVPEAVRSQVKRVKEILGSASYYIVAVVEMKNGPDQVVALLRPHALKRSQEGFRLLARMIKNLEGQFDPETLEIVREMVEESESHAKTETDSRISQLQTEEAKKIYDGQKIRVGDQEFTLRVPPVLAAGEAYRFMERAPGVHFKELPEDTEAQRAHKRDVAKAYLAFEVGRILSGGTFDTDRHGAQMRVDGNSIYLFDFGRLSLTPPTAAERQSLGGAITEAFHAVSNGEDISKAALAVVRKRKKAGLDARYLLQVNQALLALQDFQRHLEPGDQIRVLQSALQQPIHPDITGGAIRAIMAGGEAAKIPDGEALETLATGAACIEVMPSLAPH